MTNKDLSDWLDLIKSYETLSQLYLGSSHEELNTSINKDSPMSDCFYCQYKEFIQTEQRHLKIVSGENFRVRLKQYIYNCNIYKTFYRRDWM
ncbi:hypothetical protein C0J52_12877 [Blattella germanica]|nr:hypothetical protein C0J52_12877 [Blattella germanica]